MQKLHIYLPYSSHEELFLQWEEPRDTLLVKWFPSLADRWPHKFRNFIFRSDKEKAAEIPEKALHEMLLRVRDYIKKSRDRIPEPRWREI